MQITKREFLKRLGLAGAAGVTGAAFGEGRLPRLCGDMTADESC